MTVPQQPTTPPEEELDPEVAAALERVQQQQTDEVEGAPAETVDEGTDWQAEATKWRAKATENEKRFKGLQPRIQQEIEARRAAELQQLQLEQQLAATQIAMLPEEQQAYAYQLFQQQQAQQLQQLERHQEQAVMAMVLKQHKITELSQKYGVPVEELADIDHPQLMERYAQKYAQLHKGAGRKTRKATGADRFEGGGNPAIPNKQPETFAEARERLAKNYRFVVE